MQNSLSKLFITCLNARGKSSNKGYTIIEVLLTLGIFSIGMMAMSALQSSSLIATGNIAKKAEALAALDDRVETLKGMPFYANNNSIDDDIDGNTDEWDETMPDLVAGNQTTLVLDNRYTVHWQVVDNLPQVTMPPPNVNDPVIAGSSGAGVPAGTYTVSKIISVQITLGNNLGDPNLPATNNTLASCQFVKTWAASGQRPYK
ncbi:MAG: prepilin-type N-terminal cleavage/methylation domain-containing protein [Desulfamplus sp.]|nr:prepilin-type N-terminal cleavage/methylation domain-containing protein [Desulfamplus sp.]